MYNTFGITSSTLNYKTYQDLILDIKKNLYKIPTNIDLIVGIPRSGMIPACMLGLMLSKPVCTINEFLSNTFNVDSTHRIQLNNNTIQNVLIVDDSILTGKSFKETQAKLEKINIQYSIIYLAIYYKDDTYKNVIDLALEKVATPRLFQWNYLNHVFLQDATFDIDGVLCKDPMPNENDDGEAYKHFLINAQPLFIPQYKIPYIITSRLIKYEKENFYSSIEPCHDCRICDCRPSSS